ncbi:hypothetical protein PQD13_gp20 [Gordonia phage Clawz]|uniref:Uncharacterized protein n=1 Tax=Gordonia phage Clawz TaxID=2743910 RepID=A0AAE7F9M8_9CAUD|nr:hypothetical protein PQD13_gp20 [Gordonia phage Clawz]QKY79932.1 hypothetical protein SEA_CLAWZ_20 [Gordonia phage Clawz]
MARPHVEDQWFDPLLVDAALDGRIWATDLLYAERVWLVGKLSDRGDSIQMIMTRLRISRRTAQRLRAAARRKDQPA